MGKIIKIEPANTVALKQAVFEVRRLVFVQEQQVSEDEEYDEFETTSVHLAAISNGQVVGTCRFRTTDSGIKLERFAVLKEFRRMNVGASLLQYCLKLVGEANCVYLHAQVQVVGFYAQYGFVKQGEEFVEAGIRHYKMVLKK